MDKETFRDANKRRWRKEVAKGKQACILSPSLLLILLSLLARA